MVVVDVVDVPVSPELCPGDLSSVRIPDPDPGVISASGQEGLAGVVTHCPDWGGVNTLESVEGDPANYLLFVVQIFSSNVAILDFLCISLPLLQHPMP